MLSLHIICVGGTIDKVYGTGRGVRDLEIGTPYVPKLLEKNVSGAVQFSSMSLQKLDSLDMRYGDRKEIVDVCIKEPAKKIIITHGTDTMIDTALALARAGLGEHKLIVLTGALQPAVLKGSDADFQLGLALATCFLKESGIWIAMNGVFTHDGCFKDPRTGQFLPK